MQQCIECKQPDMNITQEKYGN